VYRHGLRWWRRLGLKDKRAGWSHVFRSLDPWLVHANVLGNETYPWPKNYSQRSKRCERIFNKKGHSKNWRLRYCKSADLNNAKSKNYGRHSLLFVSGNSLIQTIRQKDRHLVYGCHALWTMRTKTAIWCTKYPHAFDENCQRHLQSTSFMLLSRDQKFSQTNVRA